MPSGLKRFHASGQTHFVTFCCWHRRPFFAEPAAKEIFEAGLERIRRQFQLCLYGYVVMPEHVHLLLGEPRRATLADAIKSLKQGVSRRLIGGWPTQAASACVGNRIRHFWQKRYYDCNIRNHEQFVEKLPYIHRNPVKKGLCAHPPKIGNGAASATTPPAAKARSKSSPSGPPEDENVPPDDSVQP